MCSCLCFISLGILLRVLLPSVAVSCRAHHIVVGWRTMKIRLVATRYVLFFFSLGSPLSFLYCLCFKLLMLLSCLWNWSTKKRCYCRCAACTSQHLLSGWHRTCTLFQRFLLLLFTSWCSSCVCNSIPSGLLGPQPRFGKKVLKIWVVCPPSGTAVLIELSAALPLRGQNTWNRSQF